MSTTFGMYGPTGEREPNPAAVPFSAPSPSLAERADERARARQVELILEQIDHLPTLSPVATRLMSITASDDADINEVARLIESDPALTTRMLSLCRRADRPMMDKVETVRRAVVLLGLDAVQSAVLSISVYDVMERAGSALDEAVGQSAGSSTSELAGLPMDAGETGAFDRAGLWRHLIGTACAAEMIADAAKGLAVKSERAFVAGLLHDLGRLALELVLPKASERVLRLAERRQCDSASVETEILGLDHHTAGRRLAECWRLPESVQQVIWLHGQPWRSVPEVEHRALIGVVSLAKSLCRELHVGWCGDHGRGARSTDLARQLGVEERTLERIAGELHERTAARCADIGLEEEPTPQLLLRSIAQANRRLSILNRGLDERAHQSQQMARVLEEVCQFQSGRGSGPIGLTSTYGEIVRSARRLMGEGLYAVLDQAGPDADWTVQQFTPDGRVQRCESMRPPPGSEAVGRSLAAMTDPSQMSVAAIGMLPWLSDYLGDAADVRTVKIVPLAAGADGSGGPSAALLHDRDPRETGLDPRGLRALLATWSSAVQDAARHEQALRLGDQLAVTNRSLAEAQASLTEAESMARLGEMTAGAAHEMNNPLTVIRGRSQLLTTRLTDPGDRAASAAIAEAAADLSELITSLHLLSDSPTLRRAPTDVRVWLTRASAHA
ncbi:MAG: HDOD domain-containing protein, partial [Planctomycetota bacterium]